MTDNGGCDALTECTDGIDEVTCGGCPAGYSGDGESGCVEIDECATDNGGCDALTTCTDGINEVTCGACPAGYTGDGESGCVEIDECATNNGGCDALTECTDGINEVTCGACPAGYAGDGISGCSDVDECADVGVCADNATCSNFGGGYSCDCDAGYEGDGNTSCSDIDECALETDTCFDLQECSNTIGSFTCGPCPAYTGDTGNECKEYLLWTDSWESSTDAAVIAGTSGDLFVSSFYGGTPEINGETFTFRRFGSVIARYNSLDGSLLWQFGTGIGDASNGELDIHDMLVDPVSGDLIIGGQSEYSGDTFIGDYNLGNLERTSTVVARIDRESGDVVWAQTMRGFKVEYADIDLSDSGEVVVGVNFITDLNFDDGYEVVATAGSRDTAVATFDVETGGRTGTAAFGSLSGQEFVENLVALPDGDVLLQGFVDNSNVTSAQIGEFLIEAIDEGPLVKEAWLARVAMDGSASWVNQISSEYRIRPSDMELMGEQALLLGAYEASATFGETTYTDGFGLLFAALDIQTGAWNWTVSEDALGSFNSNGGNGIRGPQLEIFDGYIYLPSVFRAQPGATLGTNAALLEESAIDTGRVFKFNAAGELVDQYMIVNPLSTLFIEEIAIDSGGEFFFSSSISSSGPMLWGRPFGAASSAPAVSGFGAFNDLFNF